MPPVDVVFNVRNEMIETLLLEHKVHMTWSVTMPVQQLEQLPHWTIIGNRIWNGNDCLEPKDSLLVAMHHSSLIWTFPSWILNIVFAAGICLPDVDLDVVNRLAVGVFDRAEH